MAKNTENRRFDSIPLPPTVVDALSSVPKQDFVSHSIKLDERGKRDAENEGNPELTSDNHAFYVGKMIPDSTADKVRRLMNWGAPPERLYNKAFLTGALDYLFGKVKEGEKARIVVCRSLSEILNGPQDVEDALSTERQIRLIKKIAKRKFGKRDKDLEVQDLEELPHHKDLFEALRTSVDHESGEVDIEKALSERPDEEGVVIAPETSSLQIARRLFAAAQSNTKLTNAFHNARPARLKEENESEASKYYALIEVAIRLSDLLHGLHIQGGSERQAIYNGIIIQLIKGGNGRYRNSEELKPLFDTLRGQRFETIALNNDKNFYHHKRLQTLARLRILIIAALGVAVGAGVFEVGKRHGQDVQGRKQDEINEVIRKQLKDYTFYMNGPHLSIDKSHNVEIFNEITDSILDDIKHRYHLSDEMRQELRPFLQKYLLDNRWRLRSIKYNDLARMDTADLFIAKHVLYFKNKGMQITRPYQHLHEHIPTFKAELNSKDNFVVSESSTDYTGPGGGFAGAEFEHLCTLKVGKYSHQNYEFYLMRNRHDRNRSYLVARDPWLEKSGSREKVFSSKRAKEGIKEFFRINRRYDTLSIYDYDHDIQKIEDGTTSAKEEAPKCAAKKIEDTESNRWMYKPKVYRDFFGKFEYEVIQVPTYDAETNGRIDCMYAKKPSETHFTRERFLEVVKHYCDAKGQYCL